MKKVIIDLDQDKITDLSKSDLLRLKQIADASFSKKEDELDFDKLKYYYNLVFSKSMRVVCEKTKKQLRQRIKEGYTKNDIKKVIDNASNDSFHESNDFKHVTLEFISRSDKFTKYVSELEHKKPRHIKLQNLQGGVAHKNY